MDRRRYLKQVAGIATIGLAGCSENGSPTQQPEQSPTPTPEPTGTPTPTDESTETESPTDTPTPTPKSEVSAAVVVGPGGDFRFDPEDVEIASGETVRWTWDSGGHNVKPESVPDESDWTGTEGEETFGSGHTYSHTFEVAGSYEYVCVPHEGLGMVGTVIVE